MSQNTDLSSGLEKAASDGVGRVWPAMHRKGVITKEVPVKQMKLYTSPMLPEYLGQDFTCEKLLWPSHPSVVSAAVSRERGHTSWPIALPRLGALCPRGPVRICLCHHMLSPYLTSAQRPGSSSAGVCILSAPLPCQPSLRAGRIWAANLPFAEFASQRPVLYSGTRCSRATAACSGLGPI